MTAPLKFSTLALSVSICCSETKRCCPIFSLVQAELRQVGLQLALSLLQSGLERSRIDHKK
jgi:hypothetical protein